MSTWWLIICIEDRWRVITWLCITSCARLVRFVVAKVPFQHALLCCDRAGQAAMAHAIGGPRSRDNCKELSRLCKLNVVLTTAVLISWDVM